MRAISSPLLEDTSIKGARALLINVTGGLDLALYEVNEAASLIQEEAHEEANIIFGAVIDAAVTDEIRVTVIATGFGESRRESEGRTRRNWPAGLSVAASENELTAQSRDVQSPPRVSTPLAAPDGHRTVANGNGKPIRHFGPLDDLDSAEFLRKSVS
jgi:cell division protein FtsZ